MAKILIVDDNEQNCGLLEDLVTTWGHQAFKVFQGMDAMRWAVVNQPDLILLDVMLPGMNGFEVCHELKNNPQTMHIPIIMLTVLTDMDDRMRGLKVGVDSFLSKPINYNELRCIITSLLERKAAVDNMENCEQVIDAMLVLLQCYDYELYLQACKTFQYCDTIARLLGVSDQQRKRLLAAAYVQDIGKVVAGGVMDHAVAGERVFTPLRMGTWLRLLVRYHHEQVNSPSYPAKQAEELQISLELGILTAVNRFVELGADRNDKDACLGFLQKEAARGCWRGEVVEAINQLVQDEKFIERLQSIG